MNFKEQVVIDILLLVARLLAPSEWTYDIKTIANHISVNAPKLEKAA